MNGVEEYCLARWKVLNWSYCYHKVRRKRLNSRYSRFFETLLSEEDQLYYKLMAYGAKEVREEIKMITIATTRLIRKKAHG